MVQNKRFWNLEPQKSFIFYNKVLFRVLMKFCTNFGQFAWTKVNKMKPRAILGSKIPYFQSKSYPSSNLGKYLLNIYRHLIRIRQYSTEINQRLQYCITLSGHKQNAMVIKYLNICCEWTFRSKVGCHVVNKSKFA